MARRIHWLDIILVGLFLFIIGIAAFGINAVRVQSNAIQADSNYQMRHRELDIRLTTDSMSHAQRKAFMDELTRRVLWGEAAEVEQ